MLTRPHNKHWDRGLGNYVIGMCIPFACDLFSQEKKRKIEMSYCGKYILQKERYDKIAITAR